jgi:hypothetical protein
MHSIYQLYITAPVFSMLVLDKVQDTTVKNEQLHSSTIFYLYHSSWKVVHFYQIMNRRNARKNSFLGSEKMLSTHLERKSNGHGLVSTIESFTWSSE